MTVNEVIEDQPQVAVEPEDTSSLARIEKPFDPKDVEITQKPLIIDSLLKRLRKNPAQINLKTAFQRRGDLWNQQQQSRLIESVLIRLPLPVFYFDASDDDNWLVVDGLQRLSALRNFAVEKTLKLTGLEFLPQFDGLGFDELPDDLQRRIEEAPITAFLINPGTPPNVKFIIFKRINTGGLILEPQEIRHALNQGLPADFVAEMADFEEFKRATARAISPDRMLDRDFVNRFLAFFMLGYENFKPDLDTFMNTAIAMLKDLPEDELDNIRSRFKKSMIAAETIFGDRAFRKWYHWDERRKPLSKALFDTWSVVLAQLSVLEIDILINHRHELCEAFMETMRTNEEFTKAISAATGDKNRVNTRFKTISTLVQKILHL